MSSTTHTYLFNKKSPFSFVIGGIAFFSIGTIIRSLTGLDALYAASCCVGYILIFYGLFHLRKKMMFRFSASPLYLGLLFLYLLTCIIMIIRGYTDNDGVMWISSAGFFNFHFFTPWYIICYLMPFIAMIDPDEYDFRPIVKWSIIFSWVLIIAFVLFYDDILKASIAEALGKTTDTRAEEYMSYGYIYYNVAIICLCKKYVSTKTWAINTIALLVTLAINILAARRGDSVICAILIFFNVYFSIKNLKFKYRTPALFIAFVLIIGSAYSLSSASAFAYIQKRGMHDTRSAVDNALLAQMDTEQLWFGKGLNGRYYFNLNLSDDIWGGWRYISETGYYNLVLKGGYIMTWLYILVILIPCLYGLVRSKNTLLKAIASIMLLSLLELYPYGHLQFNMKYMVIWMGVALCMNKKYLKMRDSEINTKFFK